jgi:hypothetical protein
VRCAKGLCKGPVVYWAPTHPTIPLVVLISALMMGVEGPTLGLQGVTVRSPTQPFSFNPSAFFLPTPPTPYPPPPTPPTPPPAPHSAPLPTPIMARPVNLAPLWCSAACSTIRPWRLQRAPSHSVYVKSLCARYRPTPTPPTHPHPMSTLPHLPTQAPAPVEPIFPGGVWAGGGESACLARCLCCCP